MRNNNQETATLPLRVFLVEDSRIIRERLTEALSVPGRIEVAGFADTEGGAVAALRETEWDALVLDLQLRQGSGFGVLRVLHDQGRPARAKVIILTSYAFALYRAKSEQLGADHFFDKSRDYDRVREVLEGMAVERTSDSG
jgi:DNA-binding NarL/FixJ family response regulator